MGRARATSSAKLGPERTAGMQPRTVSARISDRNCPEIRSNPLAQMTRGSPFLITSARPSATPRSAWAGTASRTARAWAMSSSAAVGSTEGASGTPGKRFRFSRLRLHLRDMVGVLRPQQHAATGPGGRIGERGAPGPSADHRDGIEVHAAAPSSASGHRARASGSEGVVRQACAQPLQPCPGDHGAVVGAQLRRGRGQLQPSLCARRCSAAPHCLVRGDAARDDERRGMPDLIPEQAQASRVGRR